MAVRTGSQYIERLAHRPREVWIAGERVTSVVDHPALARPTQSIARLYDMQHDPRHAGVLTTVLPEGGTVATAFVPARTPEDLTRRRQAYSLFAEASFGMMGRTQDYLNTTLLSFMEGQEVFARGGEQFAKNLLNYYQYIRDNDLFLSHAIVSPSNDRTKQSHEQAEKFLHLRVVKETADGLIVRGARMLATLGPIADEILVYERPVLRSGDEPYALAFAVEIDASGLRQISRELFTDAKRSTFDHPLSSHFEEADTLLIFNDVLIPWERVFVNQNVDVSNAVFPEASLRNHTAHQTNTRALAKLQVATGVAIAVAKATNVDKFLHVQEMLGECLGFVELMKSALVRSEVEAERTATGSLRPSLAPLAAARVCMSSVYYPKVVETIQKIGAGSLLMMPSAEDFKASALADDIAFYYQGANGLSSLERTRLLKLAWDIVGDAFGGRNLQYERYYAGDPVRVHAGNYMEFDKSDCNRLVAAALALGGNP